MLFSNSLLSLVQFSADGNRILVIDVIESSGNGVASESPIGLGLAVPNV